MHTNVMRVFLSSHTGSVSGLISRECPAARTIDSIVAVATMWMKHTMCELGKTRMASECDQMEARQMAHIYSTRIYKKKTARMHCDAM